jgi:hypothetical protein
MIKLIVISSLFLLLSACSEKDHIEKCVQSGLRVWEDSQAFDLKVKKEKGAADLKAKSEIKPEIDCEIQKNCTGFTPIPYASTGASPALPEKEKNSKNLTQEIKLNLEFAVTALIKHQVNPLSPTSHIEYQRSNQSAERSGG